MSKCKYTSIGGQALIEGIMMRGPRRTAMAVRVPDGSIDISEITFSSVKEKVKILNLPIIRGVVNFVESMIQGYKALSISAEKSGFADEEDGEKTPSGVMAAIMAVASVLAVVLSVFLFVYLPALAFDGLMWAFGNSIEFLAPLFEGIIKIIIMVIYMFLVSRMKDIKRVFMYHGAEHKTIFCYEAGEELTVENIKKHRRFHPRCGTSFLILMLIVSIAISSLITILFPTLRSYTLLWVAVKILFVPFICGVGYELIKFCGKYDNIVTKIISAPGMWLQRITTVEPDDSMIEVAVAAMKEVIPEKTEAE